MIVVSDHAADDARMGVRPWRIVHLSPGIARGEKRGPFGDTLTADLCMQHGRKRKPGGTLRRASRRPSPISPTVDFQDHARAMSKANFIDPQFQHGHGMANTITVGDGLFLMPQNSRRISSGHPAARNRS